MTILDFLYGERAEKLVAKKLERVLRSLRYEDTTKKFDCSKGQSKPK